VPTDRHPGVTGKGRPSFASLWASGLLALAAIAFVFFYDDLLSLMTPFLMIFAIPLLLVLSAGVLIVDIVLVAKHAKTEGGKAFLPLAILVCTALIVSLVPLQDFRTRIDFYFFKEEATAVMKELDGGALEAVPGYDGQSEKPYKLDGRYAHLTLDGRVWKIEREGFSGIYFCKKGVLDSESGYLYTSGWPAPKQGDKDAMVFPLRQGIFVIRMDLGDGWYYVATR